MALSTQPYKGARDFYPESKRQQKYIFAVWRQVCELYGYEEYDAPILEPTELYLTKGNEEIIKSQTYSFEDRGGRGVTLRTEMTPSVSRLVAGRRQELAYPLRWYSIPNCWRYERNQKGRGREFYQLNVDLFGVSDISADQEVILIADSIMQSFGAARSMYVIKLNDRKLTDFVLREYLELSQPIAHKMSVLIDRMAKIDHSEFIKKVDSLCSPSQRRAGTVEKLLEVLASQSLSSLPKKVQQQPAFREIEQVIQALQRAGIRNVEFDASLMRGFDYYNGPVFEVFDRNPENNRSMFGGGRYDGMVEMFGVAPLATVGFGMGDITLINFLASHHLLPMMTTETDIYVVLTGDVNEAAQKPLAELREAAINIAVDFSGRKIGDQLKIADKKGIPYALVIGEDELNSKRYTLKNMRTGTEEKYALTEIVRLIKDQ